MEGGAWQTTVHGDEKSRTRLSDFSFFPTKQQDTNQPSFCHFITMISFPPLSNNMLLIYEISPTSHHISNNSLFKAVQAFFQHAPQNFFSLQPLSSSKATFKFSLYLLQQHLTSHYQNLWQSSPEKQNTNLIHKEREEDLLQGIGSNHN